MNAYLDLAQKLIPAARAAGEVELHYYHQGPEVIDKSDGSPVTLADQEAEKIIDKALKELAPDIPVIGEEAVAAGHIPDISGGRFFLVDPLDGTREFISGGGDFTVNIALLEDFTPIMGLIYAPLTGKLYIGAESFAFASVGNDNLRQITVRPKPAEGLTVVASKRSNDPEALAAFLRGLHVKEQINYSSSLKFCALAAGEADLYPRLGPTSEWDTAAGEAILRAAGGMVTQLDGTPMKYGKKEIKFLNPDFVAFVPELLL